MRRSSRGNAEIDRIKEITSSAYGGSDEVIIRRESLNGD